MQDIGKITIENKPVYLIGDIHGDYNFLLSKIEELNLYNCIFFFLGDMGFNNFQAASNNFIKLDNKLFTRKIESYIIRGDNDDPELWQNANFWKQFVSFKPVNSNTRVSINDNIGIIIEGATTLDKSNLIENKDYWLNANIPVTPYDIQDFGENLKKIDFVIGHGGPILTEFLKQTKNYEEYLKDTPLQKKLEAEQRIYKQILRRYRPKRWYCGHYHLDVDTKFVWDNWSDDGVIHLKIINKHTILRIA